MAGVCKKSPSLQEKTTSSEHYLSENIKYLYSGNKQFAHSITLYIPHGARVLLQAPCSVKYNYLVHNCQEERELLVLFLVAWRMRIAFMKKELL